MKNKGFTLIELLAVIVILAIIALIATPIVLSIISDSREKARENTIDNIVKSVELAYNHAYMSENKIPNISELSAYFDMKGANMATNGTVTADGGISCTLTAVDFELTVNCGDDGTYSMTMELEPTEE